MPAPPCPRHPDVAADYRCDGCGELLCEECVQRGHRLLFCSLCGERALPVDGAPPVVTQAGSGSFVERRRAAVARTAEGYGLAEALTYPFRGYGAYLFWGFVVILLLLDLAAVVMPFGTGAMATVVPSLVLLLLIPSFLFKIANSTAQGEDELPDWPDFDFWSLFRSMLLFLVATLFCLLPAFLLLWLAGCGPMKVFAGEASLGACLLALAAGFVVAVALWIPVFGSTALYDTFGAFFRLDMHVEAMRMNPREIVVTTALLSGLLIVRAVLPALLSLLPLVGGVLGTVIGVYTLLMGPHLVGLFFRRHWGELEQIYLG